MNDDERLGAFLDGELDPAEMAMIQAEAAGDPALRERIEAMRGRDELVRQSINAMAGGDVPDRFVKAIDNGLAKPKAPGVAVNDNRLNWSVGGAIAASLALGFLLGTRLPLSGQGDDLADALEQTASGQSVQLVSGEQMTPQLTFARAGGGWCRQFRLEQKSAEPKHGLACRKDHWTIELLNPVQPQGNAGGGYLTASGDEDPLIDELSSRLRAGDPLNSEDEKAIIARHWRM